ncbi:MAG TPA: hypothetical protein DEF42_17510 [Desulfosporosinus sp.]|nr:hypothetical protein [Desulfosporosinus sp.]
MKYFFAVVMVLHGLIHLMGGVNELGLSKIEGLSAQTLVPISEFIKPLLGVLWLLAVAVFLVAAVGLVTGQPWWKAVAAGAAILSQILVIIWWPAAKVGTVANALVIIALFLL